MKNKVFVPFIVYIYLESEKQKISFHSSPETCLELKFLFIFYFEVLVSKSMFLDTIFSNPTTRTRK